MSTVDRQTVAHARRQSTSRVSSTAYGIHIAGANKANVSVLALITWLGFRQECVEYDKQPRVAGRSGWTLVDKIKLVVEDSGYDPKKAVLAAQKLVQKDGVFAVAGTVGTPINMAAMPMVMQRAASALMMVALSTDIRCPPVMAT